MQQVFRFLGVDDRFYSGRFASTQHRSKDLRRKTRLGVALSRRGRKLIRRLPLPTYLQRQVDQVLFFPFSYQIERPMLDPALRRALTDYLRNDTERFRELTGCAFEGWSV
jgi:hypothetical protein